MHHASTDLNNDLQIDAEYGDLSDLMGSSSSWRQFNAPHKYQMGWLPQEQVVDMFGAGPQTFTIEAAETIPNETALPQIVRISRPDRPTRPYWLSYRVPVGYDATMSSLYRYKLQVHTSRVTDGRTYYVTGLNDGEMFADPLANDLVIRQLAHDDTTVTFEVQRTEPDDDGDGFGETTDCDESNASVYPGAPEICDHLDNDCDLEVDEGFDACDIDADGFDELVDCDDLNPTVYPDAPELCDRLDNNCDGEIDEPDYDGDGVGNCNDICPEDPTKGGDASIGTNEGFAWCPCGVPEDVDSDGDFIPDCADNCPDDPDRGTADADGDGISDCFDQCPNDPSKWHPVFFKNCPCGVPDEDADGDEVFDCHDLCPSADDRIDSDIDGMPDCADLCPSDPWKFAPGICGCGLDDIDDDGDAVCQTEDNCANVANPSQADPDGDGVGQACDCGPNDPGNVQILDPISTLRFNSRSEMVWDLPAQTGGGELVFDVLRSDSPSSFEGAVCLAHDSSAQTVLLPPGAVGLQFYLVRAIGACGEQLGITSTEVRRSGVSCP